MSDIDNKSKYMVLGTAGHIDHGKTTLLKKLTGIDADRLKEEQERGITIDIGFAPWLDPPYYVGFIDVPGHEKFIKNMLAGTGGIDALLLVVAADESVMPQTREHLEIATLLGIDKGIIAVTKIDSVDPEFADLVIEETQELVADTFLKGAPIVRTSAVTGEGMDDLGAAIKRLADELEDRDRDGIPRLFIDRVFIVQGFGVVATGTTFSGVFKKNDPIAVFPDDVKTRIRNVHVYGTSADEAGPGQRTALNLLGVQPGEINRGMTVTRPGIFSPTQMIYADFTLLESFGKRMKNLLPVHVYHGSSELLGRIQFLDREFLEPGENAFVQVRLESPTLIWPGDRFVVRQYSPLVTMGGGEVLETHSTRFRKRHAETILAHLRNLKTAESSDLVLHILSSDDKNGYSTKELVNRTGMPDHRIIRILRHAGTEGEAFPISSDESHWLSRSAVERGKERLLAVLETYFRQNPYSSGMPKQELFSRCLNLENDVFGFILNALIDTGAVEMEDGRVALPGRVIQFSPEMSHKLDELLRSLEKTRFEGLGINAVRTTLFQNVAEDAPILDLLVHQQRLIRVSEDYFLHPSVFNGMLAEMGRRIKKGEMFGVGDFKEWFGLTRKTAIPLLEYLDRKEITRRVGNNRQWL